MFSSESNNSLLRVLAKWVLPLPEEPKNKNEPRGYYLLDKLAFDLMIASQTVYTAFYYPMTFLFIIVAKLTTFSLSD